MKRALHIVRPACVALLGALAFANVVPRGDFVFDDHVLIERNVDIRRSDIWWTAFRRDYYATSQEMGGSGYYRPIVVLCNAGDLRLWRGRRWGYHVTNLVLHAGASAALGAALRALGATGAAAWVAAVLFAVHPVHAESVAFASGRVDVLAGLGVFLALAAAASRRRFAWLVVGAAALGAFLSKEAAVVLPLLLALVWVARARSERDAGVMGDRAASGWLTKQVAAVAVACGVALALRRLALHAWLPATAQGAPIGQRALLPFETILFALSSLYAPVRRLALEPQPVHVGALRLALGAAAALVLWIAAWRADRPARPLLGRSLWGAGLALLPVLNLFPQETLLSERYLYLASAFLLVPVGVLVVAGWRRGGNARPLTAGACAVAALALLGISAWRAQAWRNDETLWRQAVQEEPDRAAFWDRLGLTLTEKHRFEEAEKALRKAVALDPGLFNAQLNLGALLQSTRRHGEAIAAYQKALALQPRHVNAHLNIGVSKLDLGDLRGAYAEFQTAVAIKPDHFDAARLAGSLALRLGRLQEARRYLEQARRLYPQDERVQSELLMLGRSEQKAAARP